MSSSQTIIAALKFQGGAVIASDTQASDFVAGVRWECEKLDCIGGHPVVIGFSGSIGRGQRARAAIEKITFYPNMFDKKERIRDALDRILKPIYKEIKEESVSKTPFILQQGLWGLGVYWAEGDTQILECPVNGDTEFCPDFRAIGSGVNTAHAIYKTLGGKRLTSLDEPKAILAILRILRTSISVEQQGVSEPLSIWIIADGKARVLTDDEIEHYKELMSLWLEKERQVSWL